ncbi:MAG: hypothetical protein ACJATP_002692 [Candidatus Azotimanducaceae bacterium]|jgi:hypothetical protein
MTLPHVTLLASQPLQVAISELGIIVNVSRIMFVALLPQQLLGHDFAAKLLLNVLVVGLDKTAALSHVDEKTISAPIYAQPYPRAASR